MAQMTEAAPDLFRITTFLEPFNLQFSQFLVRDVEPLLFHTGPRALFPAVKEAVASLIDVRTLRWIGFSHFEADECGSLPEWQQLAPQAEAVCSLVGKLVSVDDCLAVRPAKGMADGEVLQTGTYRFRFLATPHVPHCWESGLLFEETQRTLLCSDLFHQAGRGAGDAVGCGRPLPGRARGISARAAGRLHALLHADGSHHQTAGGPAAEDPGDHARLGLRRRREQSTARSRHGLSRGLGSSVKSKPGKVSSG